MSDHDYSQQELLICVIARLLEGIDHIAVGVSSPIPGSAALLQRALAPATTRVTILNSRNLQSLNDGVTELFDMAAQGRVGAFFLSGGQIDGSGNINLVGVGDYPQMKVRWSGSFGSAMLYYLVPRVILFRAEHSRRTMVDQVDFISAPGCSDADVHRPGGPHALVTNLCAFSYQKARLKPGSLIQGSLIQGSAQHKPGPEIPAQSATGHGATHITTSNQSTGKQGHFRLESIHPGHTLEEILDQTGFAFEIPDHIPVTPAPEPDRLELLRTRLALEIADPYPAFAAQVWNTQSTAM